tara:strand:+ start:657 stop:1319 length:663 start_codon:yes stop_codon:yes gene_type:complete
MGCDQIIVHDTNLCPNCWKNITFIHSPICTCCGTPFDHDSKQDKCAACLDQPPLYTMARSALAYCSYSRKFITDFKFRDKTHYTNTLANWMILAGNSCLNSGTIIIPVPLHRRRLINRTYNQSALLAKTIAKHTSKPAYLHGLLRTRHTTPQTQLSKSKRQKNLKKAFTVNPTYADIIKGASVILVDDVITTETTINSCCKALLDGGATKVNVLTLARKL